jgi:hypothetical protein
MVLGDGFWGVYDGKEALDRDNDDRFEAANQGRPNRTRRSTPS